MDLRWHTSDGHVLKLGFNVEGPVKPKTVTTILLSKTTPPQQNKALKQSIQNCREQLFFNVGFGFLMSFIDLVV